MQADVPGNTLYIGWDVGGWNCDKNKSSRDALVVLDANRTLLGQPWRGNLRTAINQVTSGMHALARFAPRSTLVGVWQGAIFVPKDGLEHE